MAAKWLTPFIFSVFCFATTACTTAPTLTKIALLAPFEGRYREIGYDALYAARLALQEAETNQIELLPIDDGGTVASAVDRAHALTQDPMIKAILVLGYAATDAETLAAFGELPVLVVGYWGVKPIGEHMIILANPDAESYYTIAARTDVLDVAQFAEPVAGGEILALKQVSEIAPELDNITIVTSMPLPDSEFTERYMSSDPFTLKPGLFAPLTYEAMRIAIQETDFISATSYESAPIFTYQYGNSGELIPVDRVIE